MSGTFNYLVFGTLLAVLVVVVGAYINVVIGDAPTTIELTAHGRQIYGEQCASCHGENLEGQPDWRVRNDDGTLPAPPHDESGHTWHHPDSLLFDITRDGGQKNAPEGFKSAMPAFQDILSDDEIWAVLAYIKSRWPKEIRSRHAQMAERMKMN